MIAGLDPKTFKPFVANLDLIGCPMVTEDFVVGGTCTEQLYGMCESLYEPDLVSLAILVHTIVHTNVSFNVPYGFLNPFYIRISRTPATHPKILSASQQNLKHNDTLRAIPFKCVWAGREKCKIEIRGAGGPEKN